MKRATMMMDAFLSILTTFLLCFSLFNPQVHGIVRRSSSFNTGRIEHLYKNPQAHIEGSKTLFLYLRVVFFFSLWCVWWRNVHGSSKGIPVSST